jgi:drug/metabolite transporter (DMT)-like permease
MTDVAVRPDAVVVRTRRRALAAVVLAVVGWSASSLFVRAAHADAAVFTTWRLWFALPPLAVIVAHRRRANPDLQIWPEDVPRGRALLLLLGGGAFFASGAATAFAAIDLTRLLDVTLITSLQPVLVLVFAVMVLRERVTRAQIALPVVAVIGTIVVASAASGRGHWSLTGEIVAVASLVLNAGWFLYGRVLRSRSAIDPFAVMLGVLGAAALLLTPIAVIESGGLDLRAAAFGFAVCTMISGTTAHVLMIWAHRYVPASVSAPLLLAEPPLVALAAWGLFGETLGPVEILASLVVVAALAAVTRSPVLDHAEELSPDPVAPT